MKIWIVTEYIKETEFPIINPVLYDNYDDAEKVFIELIECVSKITQNEIDKCIDNEIYNDDNYTITIHYRNLT